MDNGPETTWLDPALISPEFGRTQYWRGAVVLTLNATTEEVGLVMLSEHSLIFFDASSVWTAQNTDMTIRCENDITVR
jgi:hypothetical protein